MDKDQLLDHFFTKYEFENPARDNFDRIVPQHAFEFYQDPFVSEYLIHSGFSPVYPEQKQFAVCITHDIDWLQTKPWSLKTRINQQMRAILSGKKSKIIENRAKSKGIKLDTISIENTLSDYSSYNALSTFFFLSLTRSEQDFNYHVGDFIAEFERLKLNTCEIGLHGGHKAYKNCKKMNAEKKRLEESAGVKVTGYRNHYLKFEPGLTWNYINENGFSYDSTFGFAQVPGFRNGMCHPFPAFDRNRNFMPLMVLPLHIMDTSLFHYFKGNNEERFNLARIIIDQIAEKKGVFTLLWHNTSTSEEKKELFARILNYCQQKNAWFTTCNNIIEYYKDNNYHQQIRELLK